MKLLMIFFVFIVTIIAQSNLFFIFSFSHESYDPNFTKSFVVPSLGLCYNLNFTSETVINFGLKIDYSSYSIFLNHSLVDNYGDLKSDYYQAIYLDLEPNLSFYIKSDFWVKTALASHYLSSEKINYKNSDPKQGEVFIDGIGTVNLSVDK